MFFDFNVESEENRPLSNLLKRYKERKDLQDAFPEVENGNYQLLINWAARVVKGELDDKDEVLFKHKNWFLKNQKFTKLPAREQEVKNILNLTEYPMKHSLAKTLEKNDINEHIPTLFLITIEFNLKNVVELGVRDGTITISLTEAVSHLNGHVWSIDKDECDEAKQEISSRSLEKFWTFYQGDDLDIGRGWKERIDHLFIDTSHTYQHTLSELVLFEKFLNPNAFITLHDTSSFPSVLKAVKDFIIQSKQEYRFYNYFNKNGLGVLRKKN